MSSNRKRSVGSPDAAEQPSRNAGRPLSVLFSFIPRIPVKQFTCLLALLFFCLFCIAPAIADGVDYWAPWITKLTTTSANINWRGSDSGSGSIEYATSSYYEEHKSFQNKAESTTTGAYQHIPITGLQADTSYVYKVKPSDNPDTFSNRTFKTMPVSGPFTFIVLSDSHAQEKRFKYVADAIAANETDVLFILDGGDYAGWDYEQYWSVYFQYADGVLAKFPIFNTIGNHEYHNLGHADGPPTDAEQYHSTFDIPKNGALNHSFDCSGIRFVVLNSPDPNHANGDDPHTSLALAESQASWLEQQLNNTMSGTFTIHHHPIWDYGRTGIDRNLRPWENLYHKYSISANFAGHTHCYQRYSVSGIPYFVVGNAGGKFDDLNPDDRRAKWYQYGETRQLGYLKVTVDPEHNTATAQEIFVAYVETDDSEKATVYDPPIVADTVTFPLSSKHSSLTVTKSGLGTGTVSSSPAYVNCGSTCSVNFKSSTKVTFTPSPDKGSVFTGWTGVCRGRGSCSVVMRPSDSTAIGAVFETGSCTYSISPKARTVTYKGGQITIQVTAKDYTYCRKPEIKNDTGWIIYTATDLTNNKGSVLLTIPEHDNPEGRTGTLTIGENTFTLTQKGKP